MHDRSENYEFESSEKYTPSANFVDLPPAGPKLRFRQSVEAIARAMPEVKSMDRMIEENARITLTMRSSTEAQRIGDLAMVCTIVLFTFDPSLIEVPDSYTLT